MRTFSPGWATDLAVLEHSGSVVEDHGDHLVVRTPRNPDFHWGNCLFVTDEDAVDDAGKWVKTFQSAFPAATWVAIGLGRMPDDQDAWVAQGVDLERGSLRGRPRRDVRSPIGTSGPPSARSRTTYSSPTWASSGAVRRRATRAWAPTKTTGGAG